MYHRQPITAILLLAGILPAGCRSPERTAPTAEERAANEAQLDRLKTLVGDWYLVGGSRLGQEIEPDLEKPFITFTLSPSGHYVVEKMLVDRPNEMMTIYYLDRGRLRMDHYCSLGNQPSMVAVPGTDHDIEFELTTVGNLDDPNTLHISSHSFDFIGSEEISSNWGATRDGDAVTGSVYKVRRLSGP